MHLLIPPLLDVCEGSCTIMGEDIPHFNSKLQDCRSTNIPDQSKPDLRMNALASHAQVVAAGSPQQVADAMRDAEQYKEPLLERAVLVIPLPIYEGEPAAQEDGASNSSSSAEQAKVDLRYATILLWVRKQASAERINFHISSYAFWACSAGGRRSQESFHREQLRW